MKKNISATICIFFMSITSSARGYESDNEKEDALMIEQYLHDADAEKIIALLSNKNINIDPIASFRSRSLVIDYIKSMNKSEAENCRKAAAVYERIWLNEANLNNKAIDLNTDNDNFNCSDAAKKIEKTNSGSSSAIIELIKEDDASDVIFYILRNENIIIDPTHKEGILKYLIDYVKPISPNNYEDNKDAYLAISKIDTDNPLYKNKYKYYLNQIQASNESIEGKYVKDKDDFSGIVFYTNKSKPRYMDDRSYIQTYFATKKEDGMIIQRTVINYSSNEWLFIEKVSVNIDGKIYNINIDKSDWKRDHNTRIWEWSDTASSWDDIELLKKIAYSKKSTLRFYGKNYYSDMVINNSDKQSLRDSIELYKYLAKKWGVGE